MLSNSLSKHLTKEQIKITIQNRIRLNIEIYFLDIYSLSKYKKHYVDVKEKVNKDIIALTKKHNIEKIGDVRFILMNELLEDKEKTNNIKKYVG